MVDGKACNVLASNKATQKNALSAMPHPRKLTTWN
jgi:hypothetical protein